MDNEHYNEMIMNLDKQDLSEGVILFGMTNATEVLCDELKKRGISPEAILDNNEYKQGTYYKGIKIEAPSYAIGHSETVLIVARAAASMAAQLRNIGYDGKIEKLVDYDSFSEYSLSDETYEHMKARLERGQRGLACCKKEFPDFFKVYCPFPALGDVFYALSYLPYYLQYRGMKDYVVCVVGEACRKVADLFGTKHIRVLDGKCMDEEVQAVLYERDGMSFVAHTDKPYVTDLTKIMTIKPISFEEMYKCGTFALPKNTEPMKPMVKECVDFPKGFIQGRSVIFSPYAKSVGNISNDYWMEKVLEYQHKGYALFTNTAHGENALPGTSPFFVSLDEMQSAVEKAGIFIGLRSGLCDVIKYADCEKTVVYPDRFFGSTPLKMIDVFNLNGWNNVVVE